MSQQVYYGSNSLKALDFIATVHKPSLIPEGLIGAAKDIFRSRTEIHFSQLVMEDLIVSPKPVRLYQRLIGLQARLDEHAIGAELLRLLHLATVEERPNKRSLSDLHMANKVLDGLAASCSTSKDVRHKILYSLSTNEFSVPLEHFVRSQPAASCREHCKDGLCPDIYITLKQESCRKLCSLILQTALLAADDELNLDTSLATALLRKTVERSNVVVKCTLFRSPRPSCTVERLPFFQAESTPQEMPSRHWRDQLANSLSRDAAFQREHIVKIVGEVCRDLENRCETAEQPFHEEQARSHDLRERLEAAEARDAELSIQIQEQNHTLDDLKAEAVQRDEQARIVKKHSEALSNDIGELHKKLEYTKEQAAQAAEASSESARQKDLTYIAIMKGKDEESNAQSDKINSLSGRINELDKEIADYQDRGVTQTRRVENLEQSLAERTHDLGQAEVRAEAQLVEIEQLKAVNTQRLAENANANTRLEDAAKEYAVLVSEKSELQAKLVDLATANTLEVQNLNMSHAEMIQKLRKDREEVGKSHERAAKISNAKIKDLETKVAFLRRERDDQEKVLADYAEMNNKIASRLRTRQQPIDPPAIEAIVEKDDWIRRDGCTEEPSPNMSIEEDDLTKSFRSSTSSHSGGPTPKRTRIGNRRSDKRSLTTSRKSSHMLTARRATTSHPVKGTRQPLGNIGTASQSANLLIPTQPLTAKAGRRHTTAAILEMDENEYATEEIDYGDSSLNDFNDSDLFTSTKRHLLEIHSDQDQGHDDDGTTVDI